MSSPTAAVLLAFADRYMAAGNANDRASRDLDRHVLDAAELLAGVGESERSVALARLVIERLTADGAAYEAGQIARAAESLDARGKLGAAQRKSVRSFLQRAAAAPADERTGE